MSQDQADRGFRGDIQGLRALAVVLVVLDHARVGPFHGGYVGVDAFFVVSGFLITGLLLCEAQTTGRVSLLGFYARRARRILPAATLVLLVTVLASLALLSAVQADEVVHDALWATFFVANVKLARDGADYFHADASTSPLQHFWSLAVEEQFYVVWPVLLLVGCALIGLVLRRRAHGMGPDRAAAIRGFATTAVSVVVVASFIWSVLASGRDGNDTAAQAYFSPFTRAWELGVGALVACGAAHLAARAARGPGAASAGGSRGGVPIVAALLGWAGLAAVVTSSLVFDASTAFPGYAAAVPVLGTAALIVSGSVVPAWGPGRLLGLMPLRRVGDWSYSIYLWHWPVLILTAEAWRRPQGWSLATALIGILALSAGTYRFVEDPIRRARVLRTRRLVPVLLYPTVLAVTLPTLAAAGAVVHGEVEGGGAPITVSSYGQSGRAGAGSTRFSADSVVALVQASIAAARNGVAIPAGLQPSLLGLETDIPDLGRCEYYLINRDHRPLCPRGVKDSDKTMILIGDSHARQWIPALGPLAEQHGYRVFYLVREGCPAADVTPLDSDDGPNDDCAAFQDWARAEVKAMHPDLVVLASDANRRGFVTDTGEHVDDVATMATLYREGMQREIADVSPYAGRVVLIGDPPAVTLKPGECLSARGATLSGCLSPEDPESLVFIAAEQQAAAATHAGYIDTRSWFCDDGVCPSVVGTYVPHRDRYHVSQPYAAYLAPALEPGLFDQAPS